MKYCFQYGIAPHFTDLIVKDLANSPFTFKFDETTKPQVKKQYDARAGLVLVRDFGSLFVGHCTPEDLVSHFNEFVTRMKWDPKYLLHIGMNVPNVNLSSEKRFLADFKWKTIYILKTFQRHCRSWTLTLTTLPAMYFF